jgi:hypothetical protein
VACIVHEIRPEIMRPADKATGTSGRPTVQTETAVTVRTLEVARIRPLGDRCDK